jgi:hypothetical protein
VGICATEDAIIAKGFFKRNTLDDVRADLRKALSDVSLSSQLDQRYVLRGAHMTLGRFRTVEDLAPLAVQIGALHNSSLGKFVASKATLVVNDFYMTKGKVEVLAEFDFNKVITTHTD